MENLSSRPQNLIIEARHTLSLAVAKQRRLEVPSSLFLPRIPSTRITNIIKKTEGNKWTVCKSPIEKAEEIEGVSPAKKAYIVEEELLTPPNKEILRQQKKLEKIKRKEIKRVAKDEKRKLKAARSVTEKAIKSSTNESLDTTHAKEGICNLTKESKQDEGDSVNQIKNAVWDSKAFIRCFYGEHLAKQSANKVLYTNWENKEVNRSQLEGIPDEKERHLFNTGLTKTTKTEEGALNIRDLRYKSLFIEREKEVQGKGNLHKQILAIANEVSSKDKRSPLKKILARSRKADDDRRELIHILSGESDQSAPSPIQEIENETTENVELNQSLFEKTQPVEEIATRSDAMRMQTPPELVYCVPSVRTVETTYPLYVYAQPKSIPNVSENLQTEVEQSSFQAQTPIETVGKPPTSLCQITDAEAQAASQSSQWQTSLTTTEEQPNQFGQITASFSFQRQTPSSTVEELPNSMDQTTNSETQSVTSSSPNQMTVDKSIPVQQIPNCALPIFQAQAQLTTVVQQPNTDGQNVNSVLPNFQRQTTLQTVITPPNALRQTATLETEAITSSFQRQTPSQTVVEQPNLYGQIAYVAPQSFQAQTPLTTDVCSPKPFSLISHSGQQHFQTQGPLTTMVQHPNLYGQISDSAPPNCQVQRPMTTLLQHNNPYGQVGHSTLPNFQAQGPLTTIVQQLNQYGHIANSTLPNSQAQTPLTAVVPESNPYGNISHLTPSNSQAQTQFTTVVQQPNPYGQVAHSALPNFQAQTPFTMVVQQPNPYGQMTPLTLPNSQSQTPLITVVHQPNPYGHITHLAPVNSQTQTPLQTVREQPNPLKPKRGLETEAVKFSSQRKSPLLAGEIIDLETEESVEIKESRQKQKPLQTTVQQLDLLSLFRNLPISIPRKSTSSLRDLLSMPDASDIDVANAFSTIFKKAQEEGVLSSREVVQKPVPPKPRTRKYKAAAPKKNEQTCNTLPPAHNRPLQLAQQNMYPESNNFAASYPQHNPPQQYVQYFKRVFEEPINVLPLAYTQQCHQISCPQLSPSTTNSSSPDNRYQPYQCTDNQSTLNCRQQVHIPRAAVRSTTAHGMHPSFREYNINHSRNLEQSEMPNRIPTIRSQPGQQNYLNQAPLNPQPMRYVPSSLAVNHQIAQQQSLSRSRVDIQTANAMYLRSIGTYQNGSAYKPPEIQSNKFNPPKQNYQNLDYFAAQNSVHGRNSVNISANRSTHGRSSIIQADSTTGNYSPSSLPLRRELLFSSQRNSTPLNTFNSANNLNFYNR